MKRILALSLAISFIFLKEEELFAQKEPPHDTAYYTSYPGLFMFRVYGTQKYASLNFPSENNSKDLRYTANTKLGFGVGATYKGFTLNVAYGFLKKNERGDTKGLDLQMHVTPYKWAADVILTSYKGSYISSKGYGSQDDNSYYTRDDIKLGLFGLSLFRVPNAEKFSYRAALVQNEWQKKSAGSLLYGGSVYYGSLKGDSSLIPGRLQAQFPNAAGIDDVHFITIGPGIGYAYTLVAAKHIFIMGSLVGNLNVSFSSEDNVSTGKSTTSLEPMAIYKAAAGYNGDTWSIAAILAGNALLFKGEAVNKTYYLSTGNYKLFIAKKIILKKHKG